NPKPQVPTAPALSTVIAQAVRTFRESAYLTQSDLAVSMRALGNDWTASTVSKVESGDRSVTLFEGACLSLIVQQPLPRFFLSATGDHDTDVALGDFLLWSSRLHDYTTALGPLTLPMRDGPVHWPELSSSPLGDAATRAWVDSELSRWVQAQELLRNQITDRNIRAKRA